MGCFSLYCEKCGLEFDSFDTETLKEIYGKNIPKELKKIQKSGALHDGIFIKDNIKYYIMNYDSYGGFDIVKCENVLNPSSKVNNCEKFIDVSAYMHRSDSHKHILTHQNCPEICVKHYKIAERLHGQHLDDNTYLRIVFPISISDRDEKIQKLLRIYNPVWKKLQYKTFEYLEKEKKGSNGYILNPGTNRFVLKTKKIGKEILEKSEKISDLIYAQ